MNPEKILITGGSVSIGSSLVHYQNMLSRNVTVFDLQQFSESATHEDRPVEVVIGDITDPDSINRAGDVARNYSNITKARSMLGWSPEVDLADGISKTWQRFESVMRAAK